MQQIIIAPKTIQKQILREENTKNKLSNIKCYTLNEFISRVTFSFKHTAIYYLMKKYQMKYDIARMYLNQMKYLNTIKSVKTDKIEEYYQYLKQNNLIIEDYLFKKSIKNSEIKIIGYPQLRLEEQRIFNDLKVEKMSINTTKYQPIIYEWETIEDEITFVALNILELLQKGIEPSKIKLLDVQKEYLHPLKRIFDWFQIPLELNNTMIINTQIGTNYIRSLESGKGKEEIEILYQSSQNEFERGCYQEIINIMNKYAEIPLDSYVIECLKEELNKPLPTLHNQESITNVTLNEQSDSYYFLLGFNQGVYPKVFKDEDYFSDKEKQQFHFSTSLDENRILKQELKENLFTKPHLIITYKNKTPFNTYYPSALIKEWDLSVNKTSLPSPYIYSDLYNKIILTKRKDQKIKYNIITEDYPLLDHHYKIPYNTYNNKFTGLKKEVAQYEKLILSYSHLDQYFRCGFRYYIAHILKLTESEDTFALLIGNLFHYLLSKSFLPNFDFELEWNQYLKEKELTKKDHFFLKERKDDLKFIIETMKEQDQYSNFNQALYEEKVYINKDKQIPITFMGVIDKLKYHQQENKTLVAIVDYKTGSPSININQSIYGIDLQLPIYLYLAKNMKKFDNVEVVGFYLQKILPKLITYDNKKNYLYQKKDALKLEGYSLNNEELLSAFDSTYQDSQLIKSMKISKNGFYSYSKVLSEQQINKLVQLVDQKLEEAIDHILDFDFEINPKRIGDNNVGCEFCSFKDLCYRKEKDIINLKEYKNLEFLGDEENGESLDTRTN